MLKSKLDSVALLTSVLELITVVVSVIDEHAVTLSAQQAGAAQAG